MKLLLDENLSRKLVPFLQEDYPGSSHVVFLGLERQADRRIWDYAKANDFVIVTSDSDFHEMSLLADSPPKIIWLKSGNRSKAAILNLLLQHGKSIERLLIAEAKSCVEIYG